MIAPPLGVWTVVNQPTPQMHVAIERSGAVWNAQINGEKTSATSLDLRTGQYELRLHEAGGKLLGFVIALAPMTGGNGYATPIELTARGTSAWRGTVTPLDDSPRIHFISLRDAAGTVSGFIRDPIRNAGASVGTLHADLRENAVRWSTNNGETIATFDPATDRVQITMPHAPPAIAIRDDEHTLDAAPSASANRLLDDSGPDSYWNTGPPDAQQLDSSALLRLAAALTRVQTTSLHAPYIQSTIVARGRTIVFERYFYGWNAQRPHDMRSASKSLTPILMGVAMQSGARIDTSIPILDYFHYAHYANDTPEKHHVTVGEALAMNTGLACDDYDDDSPGAEDRMQAAPDWYAFVLDLAMVAPPGTHAAYCSGGINLVDGAIATATHMWTAQLFSEKLAQPLDITDYYLPITPMGEMYGGGGVWMRPRDFMKFGRLYLQHGVWNEHRIIADSWIAQTLALHSTMSGNDTYGLGWHLRSYAIGGRSFRAFEAGGNGGQLLAVFPDDDLIVMMTAANYGDYSVWKNFHDYVTNYVLPAVH